MNARLRRANRFRHATSGIVAIEFGFIAPVLLAIVFGGYAVTQAVSVSRKVTITSRAMADLTTQYTAVSASDLTTILGASAEIMAPFSTAALGLRLSEITTDATGVVATVTWSKGSGSLTAYIPGSPFSLPASMLSPKTSYIYSEATYTYTPLTNTSIGTFNINDHMYMVPRLSSSVTYKG